MKNLAGNLECDTYIRTELEKAGVNLIFQNKRSKNEVSATITGQLGRFTFVRAWYYWVVSGKMPIEPARKMYLDPNGQKDIRVVGHCGCPSPDEWAEWYDRNTHRRILKMEQKVEFERYLTDPGFMKEVAEQALRDNDFADNPSIAGEGFVTSYHIDTQEGLNLFTQMIKEYQLF